MNDQKLCLLLGLSMLMLASSAGLAQTPLDASFTYQGQLKQSGAPFSGSANLDFGLYDDSAAGNLLGSQTLTAVAITDGLFSVVLNSGAEFGPEAFDGERRWLEITVNGTTLSPRQELTATPHAQFALRPWVTSGNDVSYSLGNVGIGTASPAATLDVIGTVKQDAFLLPTGAAAGQVLTSDDSGNGTWQAPPGGGLTLPYSGSADVPSPDAVFKISNTNTTNGSAVWCVTNGTNGIGLYAQATATTGFAYGLIAESASTDGRGVFGQATAATGNTHGGRFGSFSTSGIGVSGRASAATGATYGGHFQSDSDSGAIGVFGYTPNILNTVQSIGVYGRTDGLGGVGSIGVLGQATGTFNLNYGVYGQTNSPDGYAGYFTGPPGCKNFFSSPVGIGVLAPTFLLQLAQNSAAKPTSNTWTIFSDARLKKNIHPIDGALDQLMQLHGVTYQWIHPETQGNMAGTYTGMIAQDVEKVFPEWISEDKDGYKHMTVIGFEGLAVEALRELRCEKDAQLAERDARIEALSAQNADLTARLERLERLVTDPDQIEPVKTKGAHARLEARR